MESSGTKTLRQYKGSHLFLQANLLWTTSNLLGDVKAAKSKAKERVAKDEKSEEEKKDE